MQKHSIPWARMPIDEFPGGTIILGAKRMFHCNRRAVGTQMLTKASLLPLSEGNSPTPLQYSQTVPINSRPSPE